MADAFKPNAVFTFALAATAAVGLAACGSEPAQDYETDVTDQSGGELIVEDADRPGVEIDVPQTEMTNVPPDAESAPPPAAPVAPIAQ